MKISKHTNLITATITIALIALLLSFIELSDIIEILIKIKPVYFLIGFVLYTFSYLLKTLRFYILLNKEAGIKQIFSIVCVHHMAINIFPARSGELSFIYLLKKYQNKKVGESAATLIIVRILDIIAILLIFFISVIFAQDLPEMVMKAIPVVTVLIFSVFLLLCVFIFYSKNFILILKNISIFLNMDKIKIINLVLLKMDEMAESFDRFNRYQFTLSTMISILIWIILYSVVYIIVIAMGIDLRFEAFLIASTFYLVMSMLPIHGIGGFGTLEGSWAISFIAIGLVEEVAISSGFIIHIIILVYIFILFLMGFLALSKDNLFSRLSLLSKGQF